MMLPEATDATVSTEVTPGGPLRSGSSASGRTWDDADAPAARALVRRYESDWHDARRAGKPRPNPADYLGSLPTARSAAVLAVLRADLSLRYEIGEAVRVEEYVERFPELEGEALVGLIYEEYCLREESGEQLSPAEYRGRFPQVAPALDRVLDIHGLVGSGATGDFTAETVAPSEVPLPEVGQSIGDFDLIEELGRGSFGRVFLARQRHLSDRLVALKVTRTGAREPRTLARLQHTHIVPIYSFQTDPETGLHLMCMPYFGRLTLARLLTQPELREGVCGADIVAAVERLEPLKAGEVRPVGRFELESRGFDAAIAWWGARLADALQHAHDRGILHRDIKPSNVLIGVDGMPMLLDFNLAADRRIGDDSDAGPEALGGTVVYMAPEHLEALAEGRHDLVTTQSDVFALGVLLFEVLSGRRPFPDPPKGGTIDQVLRRAAEIRRSGPPDLRETNPEVASGLAAIVEKCLEPDPADRYPSAEALAEDLQALADDGPLIHAPEPLPSRSLRWARRNRRKALIAVPILAAVIGSAWLWDRSREIRGRIDAVILQGTTLMDQGKLIEARERFSVAAQLAEDWRRLFGEPLETARRYLALVNERLRAHDQADRIFAVGGRDRFELLGFGSDPRGALDRVDEALKPLGVFSDPRWTAEAGVIQLDKSTQVRLLDEVSELLFLEAVALIQSPDPSNWSAALSRIDRALWFARPGAPWHTLRRLALDKIRSASPPDGSHTNSKMGRDESEQLDDEMPHPQEVTSAVTCFQWGGLLMLRNQHSEGIRWLDRATTLHPSNYWYHYYVARQYYLTGQMNKAHEHFSTSIALAPDSPWAYFGRAKVDRDAGVLVQARRDLDRALSLAPDPVFPPARLERGLVLQMIGDYPGARADYDAVIAGQPAPNDEISRSARLNRARLDALAGDEIAARAEYEALLARDRRNALAWFGLAHLDLQAGRPAEAERILDRLLDEDFDRGTELPIRPGALVEVEGDERASSSPRFGKSAHERAQLLAKRALARLMRGQAVAAFEDAEAAQKLNSAPSHDRLRARTALAARRYDQLRLDRPEDIRLWPLGGRSLRMSLHTAVAALARSGSGLSEAEALRTRALLLTALDLRESEAVADLAVARFPESSAALLTRARIRHLRGRAHDAFEDVERGLALEPEDPRFLELRGQLKIETGRVSDGLNDLDRTTRLGAPPSIHRLRAQAFAELDSPQPARAAWSRAIALDAEDPRLRLGRAELEIRLGQWDQALADLEEARQWVQDDPSLLTRLTLDYARVLPTRPNLGPRFLELARRAGQAWIARAAERPPVRSGP